MFYKLTTRYIGSILFIFIVLVGIVFRFYQLGNIPNSLNWDEVSWGYNAYSILISGQDEHGNFLPLSFKAFGDFKQPVYVYLTSLSIWLFGLNSFAVRFPSAFIGVLTIPFVWLLVINLFEKEKYKYVIAFITMFFFAVSPWSIQFSRVAFEANIGLFFVISGVALLLLGINRNNIYFSLLGVILMSLSCFSYHSNKIFTPIIFLFFMLFAKFKYKLPRKKILILILFFASINLLWIVDTRTTVRGRSVTFISNQTPILEDSTQQIIYDDKRSDELGKLLHNRRIIYSSYYLENYLKHFDPNFLFLSGDNARHHTYGLGVLYLVSFPLIILGLLKFDYKKYWIMPIWLLFAPAASALAVDAPNASRSLVFLPIWQIAEALGIMTIFNIQNILRRRIAASVIIILLSMNLIYFAHNYLKHTNTEYGIYWQNGYKEAMITASRYKNSAQRVIVSNEFEQAYIFYLFHNKIDPNAYLLNGGSKRIKEKCYAIEGVYFGDCNDKYHKGALLISKKLLDNKSILKIEDIKGDDGSTVGYVFRII